MKIWQRFLLLNLTLALLLAGGAWTAYRDWQTFEMTHTVATVQPEAEAFDLDSLAEPLSEVPSNGWDEVALMNPFSFDRSDVAYLPDAGPVVVGDKPLLVGTMSLGGDLMAMLAPAGAGNARSYQPIRVGESVDGWRLVEIQGKSVVVEANAVQQTLIMNDPSASIPRETVRATNRARSNEPVVVASEPVEAETSAVLAPTASATVAPATAVPRITTAPVRLGPNDEPAPGTRIVVTPWGRFQVQD